MITDKTKVIFGELISNPAQKVLDIPEVAKVAHEETFTYISQFIINSTMKDIDEH